MELEELGYFEEIGIYNAHGFDQKVYIKALNHGYAYVKFNEHSNTVYKTDEEDRQLVFTPEEIKAVYKIMQRKEWIE